MKKQSFREWRRKKGLSVEDFSRSVDIPFSTVSKLDCYPDRVPRAVYRKMIAEVFSDCPLVREWGQVKKDMRGKSTAR